MAKAQKNFYLPDGLVKWLDNLESATGIPQSRLAIAAFAQFACTPDDVRSAWYPVAMSIEREEWAFQSTEEMLLEQRISGLLNVLNASMQDKSHDGNVIRGFLRSYLNSAEEELQKIRAGKPKGRGWTKP